jgi:aspartate racemase
MKTAGVLGGMGPETTARFYELVVLKSYYQKSKKERPPMLIWSIPMNLKDEENFLKKGKNNDKYIDYLVDGAKRLESGGADFIVIPCNSVHIFIDKVRDAVDIPVISIVEESVNFVNKGNGPVILLSTGVTAESGMYQEGFDEKEVEYRLPGKKVQSKLDKLISELVNAIGSEEKENDLRDIIKDMEPKDNEFVLLACTDLQLLIREAADNQVVDTMEILADVTVERIYS